MFEEILAFAALPLAAAIVFTGIHTWFGLQVLRRNVVFADLALAQVSALGATVAVVAGHAVSSIAGYAYALIFTAAGALLLTASRAIARNVRQEAFIGVLYVVATAATVLVVDRSPQGAEHVKRMLVGSILSVAADEVVKFTVLYGLIGALHWVVRRQLLSAADDTSSGAGATVLWDLVFYLSFGVVVTSSVGTAGVLLVFCFLIVPALIGSLFSPQIGAALAIGWAAGAAASAAGIFGSFLLDAPTGAVTVVAFATALVLAGAVRAFIAAPASERNRNRRAAARAGGLVTSLLLALSGAWIVVFPAGDNPVLAAVEATMGPEYFMTPRERADYLESATAEHRHQGDVDRLYALERETRWQGDALTPDQVRRIGSMQQTLTEMGRGERFVMDHLRTRARERERWYLGVPLAVLGLIGAAGIAWRSRRVAATRDTSIDVTGA
jgi:zinc/manganese transport system permease protein